MNRVVDAISCSPAIQVEVIGIEDAASQYCTPSKIGIVDECGIGFGWTSWCDSLIRRLTGLAVTVLPFPSSLAVMLLNHNPPKAFYLLST
jgi:hypothetical protein